MSYYRRRPTVPINLKDSLSHIDKQISRGKNTISGFTLGQIIDSNCKVGPATIPISGKEYTAELIGKEMDLAGIDKTVVYHSWAREHDPRTGNRKLMELIREYHRLLPAWVILPHNTGEMEPPEELVQRMIDNGVTLARMFPKDHSFSLSEWGSGPLLAALEEHRMPVMIDLGQTSYDQISDICAAHPDLPLILSDVAYRSDRYIYPLLEIHQNLRIETSRYQTHRGIEAVCARFGSLTLIFGSQSPELACGPMAMTIRYASITQDDKERILGGNLEDLMKEVRM